MSSVVNQSSNQVSVPDGPTTAFAVVNTQDSILENTKWLEVRSLTDPTNVSPGSQLEFNIPGCSSGEYYSFKDSYFYFRYRWVLAATSGGTAVADSLQPGFKDPNSQVAPVSGFTSLPFDRFDMSMNSTPVASQMSQYGLVNYVHNLTHRTGSDMKALADQEGWYMDERNLTNPFPEDASSGPVQKNDGGAVAAANPTSIPCGTHGLSVGDFIQFAGGLTGKWAPVSGHTYQVTVVPDTDNFSINLDSSSFGALAQDALHFYKIVGNVAATEKQQCMMLQAPASRLPWQDNIAAIKRKHRWLVGGQPATGDDGKGHVDQSVVLQPACGAWTADFVPSGVDTRIRWTMGKLNHLLQAGSDAAKAKVASLQIQEAICLVRRVRMSPTQDAALLQQLQSEPIRINQKYIKAQETLVNKDVQTIRIRNILPGPACEKYVVFALRNDVVEGTAPTLGAVSTHKVPVPLTTSQMTFNDVAADDSMGNGIKYARLSVAGTDHPRYGDHRELSDGTVLTFGPTGGITDGVFARSGGRDTAIGYLSYLESLPNPADPPLSAEQYAQDIQPLCFDLSLSDNPELADIITEGADVSLEIQLEQALVNNYSVFVVGYQRSCLEITADKQVISDV